jgi:hypothetical protein
VGRRVPPGHLDVEVMVMHGTILRLASWPAQRHPCGVEDPSGFPFGCP